MTRNPTFPFKLAFCQKLSVRVCGKLSVQHVLTFKNMNVASSPFDTMVKPGSTLRAHLHHEGDRPHPAGSMSAGTGISSRLHKFASQARPYLVATEAPSTRLQRITRACFWLAGAAGVCTAFVFGFPQLVR